MLTDAELRHRIPHADYGQTTEHEMGQVVLHMKESKLVRYGNPIVQSSHDIPS